VGDVCIKHIMNAQIEDISLLLTRVSDFMTCILSARLLSQHLARCVVCLT